MVNTRPNGALAVSHPRARGQVVVPSLLLGIGIALAAPGDLDPSFDGNGLLSRTIGGFGRPVSSPGARRWSAGDAGNPLRFKKLGVVARGGIEPSTRGFSVPGRFLKL